MLKIQHGLSLKARVAYQIEFCEIRSPHIGGTGM
jgi:hypothetical protein